MNEAAFIKTVLELFYKADCQSELWWRFDDGVISLYAMCSDAFWWATADLEPITPENINKLEAALVECGWRWEGVLLFCARERKLRPQGAMYKNLDKDTWPLFDQAGPSREIDFLNPYTDKHEYKYSSATAKGTNA